MNHCLISKVCSKEGDTPFLKLNIADSVKLIHPDHWKKVVGDSNLFLSLPYLSSLENTLMEDVAFRYVTFYNNEYDPVGVAVAQIHRFGSGEIDVKSVSAKIDNLLPARLLDRMELRLMICGNAFSTGEYGYYFKPEIPQKEAMNNLANAMERIRKEEGRSNDKVSIMMLKDFWPGDEKRFESFLDDGFRPVSFDVNMVLKMKPDWKNWQDYTGDMTTKFRTRMNSIAKKSELLDVRELSVEDFDNHLADIDRLYNEVVDKSGIRFGTIKAETFRSFKESMPDSFICTGYFLKDELVGFRTGFIYNEILEANFVGIDYRFNEEHAIYQRMLCDFVRDGLKKGVNEIRFGRTAEQIKSCLGAVPVDMKLFVKHRNTFTNTLLKPIVETVKPNAYELRKPFKAAVYEYMNSLENLSFS
ncbi:MAG: GNAT family N-acetyltransferase [Bacteroidetes bacterium]|nr:GNAT family N-acetyltransferase [Bacteroidota bacterium]